MLELNRLAHLAHPMLRAGIVFAVFSAAVCAAADSTGNLITLRAVGPHLADAKIRYIAFNAKPTRLDESVTGRLAQRTPEQVITTLCGSVRSAYYTAFLEANNLTALAPNEPLGDKAQTLVWPACLYVKTAAGGLPTTVKSGETASEIYSRLTGGGGSPAAVSRFFNKSASNLKLVRPDQVLSAAHVTAPVTFAPKRGDAASFVDGLARAGRTQGAELQAAVLREIEPFHGRIVVGIAADTPGSVASATVRCRARSDPPFDAAATAAAYRFASQRRDASHPSLSATRADVAVVDNGFFGANPRTNPAQPFKDSPFSQKYFALDDRSTIARKMEFQLGDVWPINFSNDIEPTAISGHGTHVTGVILGGPAFAEFRSASDANPWALVSEFNVAKGSDQLTRGSQTVLQSVLSLVNVSWIVNLSVAYDGKTNKDIASAFARLFRAGEEPNLFVVAAGNSGEDVSNTLVYPAAYGGPTAENVITVAALDGDGGLAPFSNYGARAVDIAAPGCEIESWIANTHELTRLSGTSQAAPWVTFTAALLRSLDKASSAQELKVRVIASADLLDEERHCCPVK
ncbi:S8 family serine peptidase [Variovorax sp. LjRoot175]|uniref:S8 family serine peptidase n=1 Tax=Variovorax sp. LjRoot175 TaxID=3342276 RepID=UPI003ED0420B